MNNLYYKILCGFNSEREVPITSEELEKAYGIFLLGGRSVFSGGAVDSRYIHAIVPDWHKIMGWTQEHRLGADDYGELRDKGIDRAARGLQAKMQERVQYLISNGKQNLIGSNAPLA